MTPFEILAAIALLILIVRNVRKDKSEGRGVLGGKSGSTGSKLPR